MAVHGTIPVDFAMLTEGLRLVRSARRAVLVDSPLAEQPSIRSSSCSRTPWHGSGNTGREVTFPLFYLADGAVDDDRAAAHEGGGDARVIW